MFDIRTATAAQMLERADYLANFPAMNRGYRADLHAEAAALRKLAAQKQADERNEAEEEIIWNNSRIGGQA